MSTEIKQFETSNNSPLLTMLSTVISNGSGVDVLETIAKLYREERDDFRRIAFNSAMAQAQGEMKKVVPNATNNQTKSRYATYDVLDDVIRPIYTKHGFSVRYNTKPDVSDTIIHGYCLVSHKDGWTEEYYINMPSDGKGARGGDVMSRTHATMSAISYTRRCLAMMVWNISVGDDDDGNAAGRTERRQPPTKQQDPPPAQDSQELQQMKQKIWAECLLKCSGNEDQASYVLENISQFFVTSKQTGDKELVPGVKSVDDPKFTKPRVNHVFQKLELVLQ